MEISPEYAEEVRQMRGDSILDSEELDRRVAAFIAEHKLDKDRISFGYCYLETGDEYFYNGDTWYYPGSVYKVPLMMLIAEKVSSGELEQDGDFMGMPLSRVEEYETGQKLKRAKRTRIAAAAMPVCAAAVASTRTSQSSSVTA